MKEHFTTQNHIRKKRNAVQAGSGPYSYKDGVLPRFMKPEVSIGILPGILLLLISNVGPDFQFQNFTHLQTVVYSFTQYLAMTQMYYRVHGAESKKKPKCVSQCADE